MIRPEDFTPERLAELAALPPDVRLLVLDTLEYRQTKERLDREIAEYEKQAREAVTLTASYVGTLDAAAIEHVYSMLAASKWKP